MDNDRRININADLSAGTNTSVVTVSHRYYGDDDSDDCSDGICHSECGGDSDNNNRDSCGGDNGGGDDVGGHSGGTMYAAVVSTVTMTEELTLMLAV